MKHFIAEIIYRASPEKINEIVERHREFLKEGYEKGIILMSGPQVPKIGGMIVAKGNSMEAVASFFKNDPYQKEGAAEYKFVEFNPVMYQDFMKDWVGE